MSAAKRPPTTRLALRWPEEVARAFGVSADTVQRRGLLAEVRSYRLGRIVLVPVAELRAWQERNAADLWDADRIRGGSRPATAAPPRPAPRVALRWPEEVAASLGVSAEHLRRTDALRELPHVRQGRVVIVRLTALEAWIARQETPAETGEDAA